MLHPSKIAQSFAPGLLIAGPDLGDPNFDRTVVLMAEHGEQGAMGFVVNKVSTLSVGEVADSLEVALGEPVQRAVVMQGGPVQEGTLWVLFQRQGDWGDALDAVVQDDDDGEDEDGVVSLTEQLCLGHGREVLEAFVQGLRPEPFLLVLGYAGWGASQLEGETRKGAWIPVDLDLDLVFAVPVAERWEAALERAGLRPGAFVMGRVGGVA